ncbi:hypothetical protein LSAT2_027374 [Lamellibrachia satsuma]|nr:hypothetical protein LSAT2_027374 [Lamellibrachia satsuma]
MRQHQRIEAMLVYGAPCYGCHQFECRVNTLHSSTCDRYYHQQVKHAEKIWRSVVCLYVVSRCLHLRSVPLSASTLCPVVCLYVVSRCLPLRCVPLSASTLCPVVCLYAVSRCLPLRFVPLSVSTLCPVVCIYAVSRCLHLRCVPLSASTLCPVVCLYVVSRCLPLRCVPLSASTLCSAVCLYVVSRCLPLRCVPLSVSTLCPVVCVYAVSRCLPLRSVPLSASTLCPVVCLYVVSRCLPIRCVPLSASTLCPVVCLYVVSRCLPLRGLPPKAPIDRDHIFNHLVDLTVLSICILSDVDKDTKVASCLSKTRGVRPHAPTPARVPTPPRPPASPRPHARPRPHAPTPARVPTPARDPTPASGSAPAYSPEDVRTPNIFITMAGLPPVSKEQAVLESYFLSLSKFAFDKAKDIAEREKDSQKTQPLTQAWSHMLSCLVSLAMAEKAYASLLYLGQNLGHKLFGRKDSLKTSYGCVLVELKRIEEMSLAVTDSVDSSAVPSGGHFLDELFGHLCGQLCHFVMARSKVMEFYEHIVAMVGHSRSVRYQQLLDNINDITETHHKGFHHPILSPVKSSFTLECDIMRHLLTAQLHLQHWEFLPTLLQLNDAHSKLSALSGGAATKEGKKLGFVNSSKSLPLPALYQWLTKYKRLLVAKFSLYFYDVLSKQAPRSEMRHLSSKASVDFFGKIVTFQKKADVCNVSLVFDVTGMEHLYKGAGYRHPRCYCEPPKGLDSYPAIFSYPADREERHWPSVISILNDRADDLSTQEKVVYFSDERLQCTYFLTRVEPRLTFVVIFEQKKSERDSFVNNFLSDICLHLRCTKLFASLKPGSK